MEIASRGSWGFNDPHERSGKKKSSLLSGGKKYGPEVSLGGPIATLGAGDGSGDTRGRRAERAPRVVRRALARGAFPNRVARTGVSAPRCLSSSVRMASPPASLRGRSAVARPRPRGPSPSARSRPLPPRAPPRLHARERVPGSVSRPRRAHPDAPPRPPRASRLVTQHRGRMRWRQLTFRPPRGSPDHPRSLISLGAEPLKNRSAQVVRRPEQNFAPTPRRRRRARRACRRSPTRRAHPARPRAIFSRRPHVSLRRRLRRSRTRASSRSPRRSPSSRTASSPA